MKKRVLSMMLVVAMLVSMIVLPVYAETPAATEATCPHCNMPMSQIDWQTWAGAAGDVNVEGHYRLAADYEQNGQVKVTGGDLVLDLAGNTLSTTTGRPLYVNGGVLSVLDSSEEKTGTVIGKATASGAVLFINTNGTMHIYGGSFESAATTGKDGGTVAINGNLTLHDGTIKGSTSTSAGGNIQLSKGSFTMEGGRLTAGNATTSGGTIFAKAGTLNLNGGVIEAGTVGSGKSGTAVFAYTAATTDPCAVNIGSVEIPTHEKNSVVIGGSVTMNISGAPKIGYMSVNATSAPTVGEMADGASVYLAITDSMPLAAANDQMATYLEKGYFKAYGAGTVLTTDGATLIAADYDCPCCDTAAADIVWTAWTGTAEDGKHYYLTKDLELTSSISVPADTSVTLDLRGYKIVSDTVRAFMVRGNLDIVDSGVTGFVSSGTTGTNGGVFSVQATGNLELHGGTYAAQAAPGKGSVAYVLGAMTVHEGAVLDGTKAVDDTKVGSTVYVNGGTYAMDGGQIIGATAKRGGSIFVEAGALEITGGAISGGKAAVGVSGADIYVTAATSVTFADCSVADEIHINAADVLAVSGAPKLARLKLSTGVLMTLGELTAEADVTVAASGVFSVANNNAATYVANGYIKADDKKITVTDGVMSIEIFDCPCCDTPAEEVVWTPWNGDMVDGGHYYLTEKLDLSKAINVPADTTITLDLRGQEITSATVRAFLVYGNLNMVDSTGGGKVSTGTADTNGGIFSVQADGNVELYGGSYVAQAAPVKGSVAYVIGSMTVHAGATLDASAAVNDTITCGAIYTKGSFTMDGGTIIGATAKRGGSIFVEAGTLEITGGAISGGKANATEGTGDDIYVQAADAVTLTNCSIAEEVHIQAATAVTVSGAPELARLKLSEGVLLTLGELQENAEIFVAATGVFTVENENAKTYLDAGYIKAANTSSVLVVTDNVFKFLAADAPKCPHCGEYMEKINWAPFNAGTVRTTGGHFYLNKAIDRTQHLQIDAGVDSVIDLRDKDFTVTVEGQRAFTVYGTLTIMDTVDNGTVTGLGNGNGGTYNVQTGGQLHIMGGTSTADAEAAKGGVIYAEGTVEISGGTIRAGKVAGNGGNIYVANELAISGGVIGSGAAALDTNGKNGYGGNIYAASGAKVTFSAGNVQGGSSDSYGGNIYIAKGAEMSLSGGNVRNGTADVAGKLMPVTGFRGDNIYVEGILNMSEGHIIVTNTDCFGNAVLARGTATVNITGKPIDYSVGTSGNIHLLSTCTLNAEFGTQMVCRYGRFNWYKTTGEAVADFGSHENHRYVKLPAAEDITVEAGKELYLDVNGFEVNVTVNEGATLYGMDTTATVKAPGTGSVIVTGDGTVAVDADRGDLGRYIAVTKDGKTTFHQIKFNIHAISLRTSAMGFYYRTKLYCDPIVEEMVDTYGVVLSVNNVPGADFETETADNNKFTVMPGEGFESGKLITSGSVFNIMKSELTAEENKSRGEIKVYANAYVKLLVDDETTEVVMSDNGNAGLKADDADFDGVGYSMYDLMKSIDGMYTDMTEAQQTQVKDFYDTWYAKGMSGWDLASFSDFRVGFGREDITPNYKVHLAGGNLASRYSTEIKDRIYVTCVAMTDENGVTALMLTQDLISADMGHTVRTKISEATGVPFKNIMVAATHTHSAPSVAGDHENIEQYKELYYAAVVKAAKAALEDRAPAAAMTGNVQARTENGKQLVFVRRYQQLNGGYRGGNGTNENSPLISHAYDANETMQIVKFVRSGKKDILMTNLGAHATFNGATSMTAISADYPGAIRDYVESNSDCLSAHFVGGSADQNPVSELVWEDHGLDYIGYGNAIGKIALGATLQGVDMGTVGFASSIVTVNSNKINTTEEILAKAQEADAVFQAEGFAAGEAKAQELGFVGIYHARSVISHSTLSDTQDVGINVLKLGNLAFAFAPYEMSGSTAAALVEGSSYQNTFVVTNVNNSGGYIPSEQAYDIGCYESYTARVAKGSAETLNAKFIEMLTK